MALTIVLLIILLFLVLGIIYGIRKRDKKIILFSAISLLIIIAVIGKLLYAIKYTM